MSAGSIGSSRGDGFAALRDLAVALAEAGDFLQAAQRFRDALAAASRLPGPPADAVAAAAATTGAGGAAAAGPPGAPPAFGGLAAGAGAARGPGLGLGCGHSHSRGHGQGHGQAAASQLAADDGPRRELAAAHDMLAQCLMQLAIEEVEGGGGAAAAAGRGRGLELAGGRCEGGPGEREEGEAAVEMEAAREADLWEEALRSSAEACRLLPRWVPARLTYARCLRNCGFLDEALRELNGAMQILDANRAAIRAGSSEPSTDAAVAAGATSAGSAGLEAEANATAKAGAALGAAAEDSLQLDPKWDAAKHPAPEFGLPDLALEAEVADELSEVSELWQQRLARDVGLPGLRIRQDAGVLGEGPGRRVWECGVLLAAYLVQQQQQQAARPPPQDSHDGGAKAHEGSVTGAIGTAAIDLEGARVLELGCGSGLVGITAAACGARCVLTDLPPVLPAAAACAAANAGLIRAGGGSVAGN
ncbi:hypothetical protein PLESTF_000658300 [Pleodorina starrii]|nr:hypothetical protein PLESTF_000658300 [Pleodorina starrii]